MSSKRNSVQIYIKNKLGCNEPLNWSSYKTKLENYVLTAEDEEKLEYIYCYWKQGGNF